MNQNNTENKIVRHQKPDCRGELDIVREGSRYYICVCIRCKHTISVEKYRFKKTRNS